MIEQDNFKTLTYRDWNSKVYFNLNFDFWTFFDVRNHVHKPQLAPVLPYFSMVNKIISLSFIMEKHF